MTQEELEESRRIRRAENPQKKERKRGKLMSESTG